MIKKRTRPRNSNTTPDIGTPIPNLLLELTPQHRDQYQGHKRVTMAIPDYLRDYIDRTRLLSLAAQLQHAGTSILSGPIRAANLSTALCAAAVTGVKTLNATTNVIAISQRVAQVRKLRSNLDMSLLSDIEKEIRMSRLEIPDDDQTTPTAYVYPLFQSDHRQLLTWLDLRRSWRLRGHTGNTAAFAVMVGLTQVPNLLTRDHAQFMTQCAETLTNRIGKVEFALTELNRNGRIDYLVETNSSKIPGQPTY